MMKSIMKSMVVFESAPLIYSSLSKKKKRKNDEVKHEVNGCMMKSIMKSRGA